jgi:5-methyltetrahydrofolate--homocysteine methyltransferase
MALDLKSFAKTVRVLDGAWGTELQKRGLKPGACPELMNVENPSAVEAVARSYVEAGADVVLTNTFGANRFVLERHGLGGRVAELACAAVSVARKAAKGSRALVFGSIGPTGKVVMMGEVQGEQIFAAFEETAAALARGGADALVLETFNELAEAEIALDAAKAACRLPVIVSLTFGFGPEKTGTMMGNKPEDLAKLDADAFGANCGVGPEVYVTVAKMLRAATQKPIWIKPNAGLPSVVEGKTAFPMGPEEFGTFVPKLIAAGANFVGGCCGTTPEHIRAVKKALRL